MANILLVEDDALQVECYLLWLKSAQHSVFHAGHAQQAIDFLDQEYVDLVLLDMFLPVANGLQLLHTMQSYPDLCDIPVVLFSANIPDDLRELSNYGVQKVVDKTTLCRAKLLSVVKEATANAFV